MKFVQGPLFRICLIFLQIQNTVWFEERNLGKPPPYNRIAGEFGLRWKIGNGLFQKSYFFPGLIPIIPLAQETATSSKCWTEGKEPSGVGAGLGDGGPIRKKRKIKENLGDRILKSETEFSQRPFHLHVVAVFFFWVLFFYFLPLCGWCFSVPCNCVQALKISTFSLGWIWANLVFLSQHS